MNNPTPIDELPSFNVKRNCMNTLEIYRIALTKEIQKKVNEKEVLRSSTDHDELMYIEGEIRGLNQALTLANKVVEQYNHPQY